MSRFIEFSLLGLFSGGIYALIALGFVLIYKCTRVINFAVGEVMMLGAYLYYTGNVLLGLPPSQAIVLALVSVSVLSIIFEHLVLRPLSGQPVVSVLMATIGLASIIHGVVEAAWGSDTVNVPRPFPSLTLAFSDVLVPGSLVTNFAAAIMLIGLFAVFFRYSKTGITLRATASDPVTAATLGIDIRYAQRLAWVLAGIVGTIAGVLISTASGLSPLLAAGALSVFAVIILGGLDSVLGAIVAALAIGWMESIVVGYVGGKARDIVPYLAVLAILVVRPYGLFGTRQIERL
jgi:branched-chain amino acid transport system permease protein